MTRHKGNIRVCAAETHYLGSDGKERLSSVDWWRIINPLSHVAKNNPDIQVDFIKRIVEKNDRDEVKGWERIGENYDILYSSYLDTPKAYAFIKAICEKYQMTHVMDLDDNVFEVDEMNPVRLRYYPGSEDLRNAEIIISDCDVLTVTTPHLNEVTSLRRSGKPTVTIPNYIDPHKYVYDPRKVPDNGDKVVIGFQGSTTHFSDLFNTGVMHAIRRLMNKYKNVHFYIIGTPIEDVLDYLPEDRVVMEGGERDHTNWTKRWQEIPIDIGIAPLTKTAFNLGKSNIKYQEYSLRRIPAVYSNWGLYRETVVENKTGFLANDEEELFEKLSWLVENKKLRKIMGDSAAQDVLDNHTIQNHYKLWEKLIRSLNS